MTTRDWLRQNGYDDIADLIDEAMADMQRNGSKQRRNWWDVLAGGKDGTPITVSGLQFPVLRAAQLRQNKPVTPNAIQRNRRESVPAVRITNRWKS